MPVILRHRGYRFLFYSNEGNPREPPHIHVQKGEADAKYWLLPAVELAYNRGHTPSAMRELNGVVRAQQRVFLEAWHDFFSKSSDGEV